MPTTTKSTKVMWSCRIDQSLRDAVTSKVYAIKSKSDPDFTVEQAVTEALRDWIVKQS